MNSIQIEINILNKWIKQFLPEYDLFSFSLKVWSSSKAFHF